MPSVVSPGDGWPEPATIPGGAWNRPDVLAARLWPVRRGSGGHPGRTGPDRLRLRGGRHLRPRCPRARIRHPDPRRAGRRAGAVRGPAGSHRVRPRRPAIALCPRSRLCLRAPVSRLRYHPGVTERPIPEASVGRLPIYLRALVDIAESGANTVSSETLAEAAGVNSAKVRKDLSHLGSYGTRGVGYDVAYLIHQVRRELGLTQHWPIVIVGVGNLGHALANYRGFAERGFRATALLDADASKVGERIGGLVVRPVEDLPAIAGEHDALIGVICTPAPSAQAVADAMVHAGVRSILNFAPAALVVPEGVAVRKVDLAVELQILTYYEQRKAALADVKGRQGRGRRLMGRAATSRS